MKRIYKRIVPMILVVTLLMSYTCLEALAFNGNYFWFPDDMHVRISHPATGMCLGIPDNGGDGTQLELQKKETGNMNQIFYLKAITRDANGRIQYQIRVHGEDNKIIEVRNSSHEIGAEVAQWTDHNGACAKWYFFTEDNCNGDTSAVVKICNVESGLMLNVPNCSLEEGTKLTQDAENHTNEEAFYITSAEGEASQSGADFWTPDDMFVRISHPSSGLSLGIDPYNSEENGTRLELQYKDEGNTRQIFKLHAIGRDRDGLMQYQIEPYGQDKVIEVRDGSTKDWAPVAQWETHDGSCSKWYFQTETPDNTTSAVVKIQNANSKLMLNVPYNYAYAGLDLHQYHEDNSSAELFKIECANDEVTDVIWNFGWHSTNGITSDLAPAPDLALDPEPTLTPALAPAFTPSLSMGSSFQMSLFR